MRSEVRTVPSSYREATLLLTRRETDALCAAVVSAIKGVGGNATEPRPDEEYAIQSVNVTLITRPKLEPDVQSSSMTFQFNRVSLSEEV